MPCERWRATLESGPKLDLAELIPRSVGNPCPDIRCAVTNGYYASTQPELKVCTPSSVTVPPARVITIPAAESATL